MGSEFTQDLAHLDTGPALHLGVELEKLICKNCHFLRRWRTTDQRHRGSTEVDEPSRLHYFEMTYMYFMYYIRKICVRMFVRAPLNTSHIPSHNSHRSKYVFPEKCPTSRCSAEDNEWLLSLNSRRLAQRRLFLERSPVICPFPL